MVFRDLPAEEAQKRFDELAVVPEEKPLKPVKDKKQKKSKRKSVKALVPKNK